MSPPRRLRGSGQGRRCPAAAGRRSSTGAACTRAPPPSSSRPPSSSTAEIEVAKDDLKVSGISIMGLMMLAAATGATLEIRARGREARPALAALVALVESGFDED